MTQKIITTNLRIEEPEWVELKSLAARMGMSSNEYVKRAIKLAKHRDQLVKTRNKKKVSGYGALDKFIKRARKIKGKPMGASEEDKIIYGIDD